MAEANSKRGIGSEMERRAVSYLRRQGVWVLETNFHCRQGEIDIVGKDEDTLIFFEVKWRGSEISGSPEEAVDAHKQKKICIVSDHYRIKHKEFSVLNVRYDVLAMEGEEIRWIKDAFEYCGKGF